MISASTPGGVVIGSDFQSLGVIRCLRQTRVPTFLVEYEHGIARYSRHVRRRTTRRNLFHSDDGVASLLVLADREQLDGWVLFVNCDDGVEFLSRNRDVLSRRYRVPVPAWDVTHDFFDKANAYRIAAATGIPIPRIYEADDLPTLLSQDLSFPLVLKPAFKENYYEKTHKKAIRVDDRDTLVSAFAEMARLIPTSQIVVQEMICGGPRNLYSFGTVFDGERPLAGVCARRSRQHPMDFGHATTFAESVDAPEIEALAVRFLRALNYRGIAEVEFMYDERTGEYKFIEMNGRVWGWHTLAKTAGVNLPYTLYQLATGGAVDAVTATPGVKWVRTITDAPTVLAEVLGRRMSVADYARSLSGRIEDAVFSLSDPLPFFMEIALLPYLWWKKGC